MLHTIELYSTRLHEVACALEYSGVIFGQNNVAKIDKTLSFIHSHVTYSSRLLDHMWFPSETLTYESGDCTSFSILAASIFEANGVTSAIGFFKNDKGEYHAMVLVHLDDLGSYSYSSYDDLTSYNLKQGKWIIIEPQQTSLSEYSSTWVSQWHLVAASEIPYGP